jgi:hypothetical protein
MSSTSIAECRVWLSLPGKVKQLSLQRYEKSLDLRKEMNWLLKPQSKECYSRGFPDWTWKGEELRKEIDRLHEEYYL